MNFRIAVNVGLVGALLCGFASATLAADDNSTWKSSLESAEKAFLEGNNQQGEKLYQHALSVSGDDTARATILNQMGVIQIKQRRYIDAQQCFQKALDLRRKSIGDADAVTLQTLSNLALATYKLGDEKKAEELYVECVEKKRKVCPGTPSLANTLTNLANIYSDERKCLPAKKLYLEALEIDMKSYHATHGEVATDLFNVGALLYHCQEFNEALGYFEKADAIYAGLGNKNGNVKSLHYIALCHGALKNFDKASQSSLRALSLHDEVNGKGHIDSVVHMLSAANALDAADKREQAEKLYLQAMQTARSSTVPNNLRLTECNLSLAQFYRKQGKNDEAEHYFKKALVHYEDLSKREKRSLYELPLAYSKLLQELKRDQESEHLSHKYLHVYAPGNSR